MMVAISRMETRKNNNFKRDSVVVVSQEGKSCSEILKSVKEGLNPIQISNASIVSIQRTRKEDLLIRLKGARKAAEALCKAVSEHVPGLKTEMRGKRKAVMHLSDLDQDTDKEDIKQGIRSELSKINLDIGLEEVEVTSLRPAFAGTQKATVKLSQVHAHKLMRKKRILIGLVSCRLKFREDQQRCYRCWEIGHTVSKCNGPDKSRDCFKCGKEGHQKAECNTDFAGRLTPDDETTDETVATQRQ